MSKAASDLLDSVEQLIPRIAERAALDDRRRAVADNTIEDLIQVGAFAALAPRRFGGMEFGLDTFASVVWMISAASQSTGWVTAFLMGASWRLLVFPLTAQEEFFDGKNFVLGAGTAAPISGVRKVDGGYVITGRTSWNSGASHAEWFTVNGLLKQEGDAPELMTFAVPRSDVVIHDNWRILGMRATASVDVEFNDLFVPDHRSAQFGPALAGQSPGHHLDDNPMYHIPFIAFAMNEVLPVVVGTHRGAAHCLLERSRTRLGTLSEVRAAEQVVAQIRLGETQARVAMAERLLEAIVARNMAASPSDLDPVMRAEVKLHASMIANFCLDSVNEIARSMGGDGFRDEAPFQMYFRDINTVARHAFLDPETAGETYGKMMLGLSTADPLI